MNFSSFDGIRILSTAQTSGGSGWEKHTLLIAPLGWANSVSAAFVDQRDYGDQIISVNDTVTEEPLTAFGAAFNFKGLNN